MNILILATTANSEAVKRLQYEAKKRKHAVLILNPMDIFIRISSSEAGYDSVYYVYKGKVNRLNIKDCDAVIPRVGDNVGYGAFVLEHLNKNQRIFSTNSAEGLRNASNQLKTIQLMSSHGLPTPKTVFSVNPLHIQHLIEKIGGYPAVCKLLHGSGGFGVSLLKDRQTGIAILQSLFKSRSSVILQEYLEAGGTDYRVIVIGGTVVASFQRTSAKGDFRANLKQNGTGKKVTLSDEDKELCVSAARALNLSAVGIDLIKANGRTYVVEANANFGWGVEKICNINIAEMMVLFCEQNYQAKNIENSQVLSYQRQLFEVRMRNESLSKHNASLNEQFRFFTDDKFIRSIYKKAKGQTVSYQDRNRNNQQIKVENFRDIFQIMKDSFQIK